VQLDIHTFFVASTCILLGVQGITFALMARRYATRVGLFPSARYENVMRFVTLDRLLMIGMGLAALGLMGLGWSLFVWAGTNFGPLNYPLVLRILVISMTAVAIGIQLALTAFLVSVFEIATSDREKR
jgi:hypothetical protein